MQKAISRDLEQCTAALLAIGAAQRGVNDPQDLVDLTARIDAIKKTCEKMLDDNKTRDGVVREQGLKSRVRDLLDIREIEDEEGNAHLVADAIAGHAYKAVASFYVSTRIDLDALRVDHPKIVARYEIAKDESRLSFKPL